MKAKTKRLSIVLVALLIVTALMTVLAACGDDDNGVVEYNDGTYTGISATDSKGAYGVVVLVVENNLVKEATFVVYQSNSVKKGEQYYLSHYNEELSEEEQSATYKAAKLAIDTINSLGAKLVGKINPDEVDETTGATSSYNQFVEAAKDAIEKAKK